MALANVALTDTFDTQRIRINQIIINLSQNELVTANSFARANVANAFAFQVNANTTAAFSVANTANVLAHNALPNTSGITFGGNLVISGNTGIGGAASYSGLTVRRPVTEESVRIAAFTPNTQISTAYADIIAFANNGTHYSQLGHVSGGYGFLYFYANTYAIMGTINPVPLYIWSNSVTRMTVAVDGNIGIGTSSPSATLEVNGNAIVSSALAIGTTDVITAITASHAKANAALPNTSGITFAGSLKYTGSVNVATIQTHANSGATGSANQVLMSNGSTNYWAPQLRIYDVSGNQIFP